MPRHTGAPSYAVWDERWVPGPSVMTILRRRVPGTSGVDRGARQTLFDQKPAGPSPLPSLPLATESVPAQHRFQIRSELTV